MFFREENDDEIPELEEASKDLKEWLTTTFANTYQVSLTFQYSEIFYDEFYISAFKTRVGETRAKVSCKCNQNRIIHREDLFWIIHFPYDDY